MRAARRWVPSQFQTPPRFVVAAYPTTWLTRRDAVGALQVVAFSISVAGCPFMQGIEASFTSPAETAAGPPVKQLPPTFLFGTAVAYAAFSLFGILRSPFDLTVKIDLLNESFSQQRELRTSGSSHASDGGSSIGEQLDEVDPEAGRGRVQRVTRVQWLMHPTQTMEIPSRPIPSPVDGVAPAAEEEEHPSPQVRD